MPAPVFDVGWKPAGKSIDRSVSQSSLVRAKWVRGLIAIGMALACKGGQEEAERATTAAPTTTTTTTPAPTTGVGPAARLH